MIKRIVAVFILSLGCAMAHAQIIAVTATITDSDGQTWIVSAWKHVQ